MIDDLIKQLDGLLDKYYVKIIGENVNANKRRNDLLNVIKDFHCDVLTILQNTKITARKEIVLFALEMEKAMADHDLEKGDSWKDCDVEELRKSFQKKMEDVEDYWHLTVPQQMLVDLANLCMRFYNRMDGD